VNLSELIPYWALLNDNKNNFFSKEKSKHSMKLKNVKSLIFIRVTPCAYLSKLPSCYFFILPIFFSPRYFLSFLLFPFSWFSPCIWELA
jgi:hypothetical protein